MSGHSVILKLQLLKTRANKVLKDKDLRHELNAHDIKEVSDNTRLLNIQQQKVFDK